MVSEAYAYRNGTDPAFYDDYLTKVCHVCGGEYSYEDYKSADICFDCDEGEGK